MKKFLLTVFFSAILSLYIFPISFSFIPQAINSKMILAVVGVILYVLTCIRDKSIQMSKEVLLSAMIAILFSAWCYFSEVSNNTSDGSYSTYFISFATWLGGAYAIVSLMKFAYGKVDLKLLTYYFTIICVFQCAAALIMDNNPGIRAFVDRYVVQGQEFFQEVKRMYGIGAALDSGGIRFAACLVLITHQLILIKDDDSKTKLYLYLAAFLVITVVGNMISRTTSVGAVIGLVYFVIRNFVVRHGELSRTQTRTFGALLLMLLLAVLISVFLYNSNAAFRSDFRFAFEGFFNWVETGEFSTSSTDKLNRVMWVWPDNVHDWAIGTGIFGDFVYSTDIGYCRFTLYCGLIGLVIFSLFFVYNGLSIISKFNKGGLLIILLISLTFVIWLKVATDLFFLNALLFCIDPDEDEEEEEDEEEDEGMESIEA